MNPGDDSGRPAPGGVRPPRGVDSTAPARVDREVSAPTIAPGATLHHYVVEQRIGEGGMGSVWRVRQRMLQVPRAMKLLKPGVASVERFAEEMRMLAMIRHDNVVQIIEGGALPDGSLFYVMEFVEGRSLEADIAKHRGLRPQWEYVREVVLQICAGLAAIHERGILHRDMKPANCMLSPDIDQPVRVKIVDLGVARRTQVMRAGTTAEGMFVGSAAYCSPEQAAGVGRNLTYGSDVYSVGIILYELLTGVVPHMGDDPDDPVALLRRRVTGALPPPPTSQVRPGTLPPEIDEIVARALQPDPRDRFQSIGELAEALRATPAHPRPPRPPRPSQSLSQAQVSQLVGDAAQSSPGLARAAAAHASQSSPGLAFAPDLPRASSSHSRTLIAVRQPRRVAPGLVALAAMIGFGVVLAAPAVRDALSGRPARAPAAPPATRDPAPPAPPAPVLAAGLDPPVAATTVAEQVRRGCARVRERDPEGVRLLMHAVSRGAEFETDFELCRCLGDGFAGQGDDEVALQWYRRALAVRPDDRDALAGAAGSAARRGLDDRARVLYRRLLALDPQDPTARAYLAAHAEPPAD